MRDNGSGVLQIIQDIAGTATIINDKIGTIDYTTGRVIISNLTVSQYDGAGITIRCNPAKQSVSSSQNIILSYNSTPKISVTQERI